MSLVGPRPYLAEHDYLFERNYKAYRVRQFVKPGVTGPAQCRGLRGEFTDPELVSKRIEMDFNYVGNWSHMVGCGNCVPYDWPSDFSAKVSVLSTKEADCIGKFVIPCNML